MKSNKTTTFNIRLSLFPVLALVFLFIIIQHSTAQTTAQQRIDQVENSLSENLQITGTKAMNLQERMKYYKINGLSIAVIHNYKIDFVKAYGFADSAQNIPVTNNTLFQAASISKSLNALAIIKLFHDRKLDLYADINTYLKSWKFPYDSLSKGKKISTANLLSHTAGLNVHGFGGYETSSPLPTTIQILNGETPANSRAVRSVFAPGTHQQYSGGGITISQLLLTDITGQPYEKYLNGQILKPLAMTGSTFSQPPTGIKKELFATGYNIGGKEIKGKYHIYPEQAAAGLWTNPTDLARYIIETQLSLAGSSSKVLDKKNTELRLTPYMNTDGAALGVFIEDYNGTKYFGHGGANEGFRSGYYGSMEGGNGLVIMLNSDNGEIIQEIINSVSTVYGLKGLNKTRKITLADVSDKDLDSYLGRYQLTPKLILTITREGKKVFAQATGQSRIEAFAETNSKFFFTVIQANMEFIKDSTGAVKELIFTQGPTLHAKKL
jgi:CubicO group peptidase (beta-lactamase class C family)